MFLNFSFKSENSASNEAWNHNNSGKVPLSVTDTFDAPYKSDLNFIDIRMVDMNWRELGAYWTDKSKLINNTEIG